LQRARTPRTEYVRSAHLAQTDFLLSDVDARLWHVFHERYVLCSVDQASALTRYRGKNERLFDGCTMLMEPGEAHRNLVVPRPQSFRAVFVEPALFENVAKEHGMRHTPHFPSLAVADPRFMSAIYRLCASVEAQDTILEQQSRLTQCMRLAFAHAEESLPAPGPGYNSDAIRRARAYLSEHFNEPISLDEVSAYAGISSYHLVRSFSRDTGLPPHSYQIHIRIERACTLLRAGVPLAEIASSVGFADQSHFTRHFRRIMHTTPGHYASAVR
jgi:AraC-like DNA-binding protein